MTGREVPAGPGAFARLLHCVVCCELHYASFGLSLQSIMDQFELARAFPKQRHQRSSALCNRFARDLWSNLWLSATSLTGMGAIFCLMGICGTQR